MRAMLRLSSIPECWLPMKGGRLREARTLTIEREFGRLRDEEGSVDGGRDAEGTGGVVEEDIREVSEEWGTERSRSGSGGGVRGGEGGVSITNSESEFVDEVEGSGGGEPCLLREGRGVTEVKNKAVLILRSIMGPPSQEGRGVLFM